MNVARTARRAGVSVVIPTHLGAERIQRCLNSLAAQTLSHELFEVIIIMNGPQDGTRNVILGYQRLHPTLEIRTIEALETGASHARNLGISAAGRDYLTFVDDDDHVSTEFLEGLLAVASPGSVSVAFLADEVEGSDDSPNVDTNVSRAITKCATEEMSWSKIPVLIGMNACKLVPTELAQQSRYDERLRSGEDLVYWQSLVSRKQLIVRLAKPAHHCVYYRTVRPNSVSRQLPTYEFSITERLDVIGALNAWTATVDSSGDCARSLVRAQIGHMNRYLQQNQDDLTQAVDAVLERDLNYFHFPSLAKNLARDLLIAYAFPPSSDTSATVIGRRIRSRARAVDVITADLSSTRDTDVSAALVVAGYVDKLHVVSSKIAFGDWKAIADFCQNGLAAIAKLEADRTSDYHAAYSRAMWPASHFLAALHKLDNPKIPWHAEFSDPLLYDVKAELRESTMDSDTYSSRLRRSVERVADSAIESTNMWEWCELVAYALADEIIFTNDNQRDYMLGYCRVSALAQRAWEHSVVTAQPTLPTAFYNQVRSNFPLDTTKYNVGYFGNFYATRGLDEILQACRLLTPEERRGIHFHIFTATPNQLESAASALGIRETVTVYPYVPYLEFLSLTTRFDCLLINDASTEAQHISNPYLPSKWSDYQGSGSDIWAIVESGSTLSQFDTRYKSTIGDVAQAQQILADMASSSSTVVNAVVQ